MPEEIEIGGRDHPVRVATGSLSQSTSGLQYSVPAQDHREVVDLAGLDERQRLEQLVERAEPAGKDDEALRVLHEHRLAHEEVAEVQREVARTC